MFHFDNTGVYFHPYFYASIPSCALSYRFYQIEYEAANFGIEVLTEIQLIMLLIMVLVCNAI